jgi:SRSO17 transposase
MVAMKAAAVQGPALMEGRDLTSLVSSLDRFLDPYRALMARGEQRKHLGVLVSGLLSDLERKSVEPIAVRSGLPRRPLQRFVGAGRWDDRLVREMIRTEAADEIGDPGGALVVDNSGFHKQGNESVGVERQWCGRLGKVDNCQVGYFLVYSTPKGDALVDAQLYLPKSWADDAARRELTAVPRERRFLKGWELADELIAAASPHLPPCRGRFGPPPTIETLLVMRNLNHTQTWYLLANGDAPLDVEVLVSAASQRHHVEQIFGAGKGEVGLDHYEVRSWVGWHHHMTLSMLALWYLVRQRRRLGKKLRNGPFR